MKTHAELAARGRYQDAYEAALARIEQLEDVLGLGRPLPILDGLSPQCNQILWLLSRPRGEKAAVSHDRIWLHLWGEQTDPPLGDATIKVQIWRLRKWLRANAPQIKITTVYGAGYCLQNKDEVRRWYADAAAAASPSEHSLHQNVLHRPLAPQTTQHQLVDGVPG